MVLGGLTGMLVGPSVPGPRPPRGIDMALTTADMNDGTETGVDNTTDVEVLPANPSRKMMFVQNVGADPCRVGPPGVTASTGLIELAGGDALTLGPGFVPADAVHAIATTTTATTILASEIT